MAKDAADNVMWYLMVKQHYRDDLANIRPWDNLKVGEDEDCVWVKGFDLVQINAIEVKSIPYRKVYFEKDGKLYLQGSRLPDRNIPSVLWTAIDRALPVELPDFNHNYFGVKESLSISLLPTDNEVEVIAMITTMNVLGAYIANAPAIRLQPLMWTVLNSDKAMVFGKPLLPVEGSIFWQRDNHILPAGYDFELYLLSEQINHSLDADKQHWIVWHTDGTYFLIDKHDLQPLSIGSYRKSVQQMAVL